jgi:hypothetical protein
MLYKKNYDAPSSFYEKQLISHVKTSLNNALKLKSKLTALLTYDKNLKKEIPFHHLLNNLCEFGKASHLHIGLLEGESFIAALYNNQSFLKDQIGVDWFQECPENIFYSNCNKYLNPTYQIINSNCFNIDKSLVHLPIDIYFYDADHSITGHEKAFTYYNDVFSDVFVSVVDDWKCPWIRKATFVAFEKLDYTILFEGIIPSTAKDGNGQYVGVIRKSNINFKEKPNILNTPLHDGELKILNKKVCQYLKNTWCSKEKATFIMETIAKIKPKICVEIGVFTGSTLLPIAATLKHLNYGHIYAIDAWSNKEAIKHLKSDDINSKWWADVDMKNIKTQFDEMIKQWSLEPYCTTIKAPSCSAISKIPNIDFLHLDGNFSEIGSFSDVELYLPKVKKGGYILLSNLFIVVDNQITKMKSLWALLDHCDIIHEIEHSNTILLQKR